MYFCLRRYIHFRRPDIKFDLCSFVDDDGQHWYDILDFAERLELKQVESLLSHLVPARNRRLWGDIVGSIPIDTPSLWRATLNTILTNTIGIIQLGTASIYNYKSK